MTERHQVCYGRHLRRRLIVCADLLLFTAAIGIDGLSGWPKADSEVMNQCVKYMTQVTRFDESPVCVSFLLVDIVKTDSERA
jgi:hypothetical protein